MIVPAMPGPQLVVDQQRLTLAPPEAFLRPGAAWDTLANAAKDCQRRGTNW